MKKVLVLLVALLCLSSAFAEEIDLSSLSFSDLAALRDRCQMEMMTRDEWQEVTVPQGIWEVGKDIPAGTWLIRCADVGRNNISMRICVFIVYTGPERPQTEHSYNLKHTRVCVANPYNKGYQSLEDGTPTEYKVTLTDGMFFVVDSGYNAAVFTPASAPAFVFK